MKKILAIVLSAAALLLTLAGCGPKTASAGNASGGNAMPPPGTTTPPTATPRPATRAENHK